MNIEPSRRKLYTLDDDRIDRYWEEIEKLLGEVPMFYDLYDPQWVYCQAKMGGLQIWALSDGEIQGIVITQINIFPRAKVFQILAAAGKLMLRFVEESDATFEWIAREAGCEFVQVLARPGLARKLKGRGLWTGIVMTKRIGTERAQ